MSDQPTAVRPGFNLAAIFPDWITADQRPGYRGWLVLVDHWLEVAQKIRDDYGYDYLSSITGVDYLPENKMEVVYHFYKSTGGSLLECKVQVSRENPVVPSLAGLYKGAELQEREAYDLLGIEFSNHPDLRRIFLWEGFAGFPLRKDWKEAYYEEDVKPYKSRFPEGKVNRIEDRNPYRDNVSYPAGFDPYDWDADNDAKLYELLKKVQQPQEGMKTDRIIVNLGPQHPSTHGVFRMAAVLEGETVVGLKPVVGYLHRSVEKIGERNTFQQNIPFTDRLDYISSVSNNFGYVLAVEQMMGIQPTERADYLRVIMAEFTRISSHVMSIGFLLNDMGAFYTPALYTLEERELIVDLFEMVTGSRMMCNYLRFGGVARDLPAGALEKIKDLAFDRLPRKIDEIDRYLTKNEIIMERCEGIGVLTPEEAINYSASGPILRASGVPYDVRRADPYSVYERFDFDVITGIHGDIYDRYLVRLQEIRQSLRIIQQAVKSLPGGPILNGKPTFLAKVPAGEGYGRVEAPKGELGYYVVSNGKPNPWRFHVRAPSLANITSLEKMCLGEKIADAVLVLGSIDIVLGEVDR